MKLSCDKSYLHKIRFQERIKFIFGEFELIFREVKSPKYIDEIELAAFAKKARTSAGKTRAQAAREMGIKHPSIFHAEESPELPFTKLRRRMIEAYSNSNVTGPLFRIEPKD